MQEKKVIPYVFTCEPETVKKPEPEQDASIKVETGQIEIKCI